VWSAGESEAGRKVARRSEKAKVPEEGGLTRSSGAKKFVNAWVHTYTKPRARGVAASAGEYMEV
jgi:hypothetical protein